MGPARRGTAGALRAIPAQVPGLTGVTAIAAGSLHSGVLLNDGAIRAWGDNAFGQHGQGKTTHRFTPVSVSGLTGVTAIAAGDEHSLALRDDGTVWGWGDNFYGELGTGTPARVRLLSRCRTWRE